METPIELPNCICCEIVVPSLEQTIATQKTDIAVLAQINKHHRAMIKRLTEKLNDRTGKHDSLTAEPH